VKIENAISILEGMEKTTGNANVTKVPLQMAIKALKKQISYRPVEENHNYCSKCGQKIDWD